MINLSEEPNRLPINDLLKNANSIAKALSKNGYNKDTLKNLKIRQAGFSLFTPCLVKNENKDNFKKLIGHIEEYIGKKIEFSKFSLNDGDKLSNFVKSKLKYKEDKKEIENLEEPFQDAIKSIKGLIYALKERDNLKLKENFKLKFDELIKSFSNFVGSSVIGSSFQKSFKQLLKEGADLLTLYQAKDFQKNFNNDKVHEKLVLFMINLIQDASNILSNVYNIIIKISGDNKGNKQNVYYECARQINEIKNQIIKKMNDDYNKVDNNKKTAFIFICANLKLEYQYLIEKDKSKEGKIDTTKFESDSVSKIWSDFNDRTKRLTSQERYNMKMKFNPKTTEKYDYTSHEESLFHQPKFILLDGDPEISDIKQGDIGDCYLLAALQSLVGNDQGRQAIKKVFLNEKTANEDEYVKMRFFKLQFTKKDGVTCIEPSGEKTIIKINKEYLIKKKLLLFNEKAYNKTSDSCWVDCFEKAFAVYRHDKTNVVVDEQCKEDKKKLKNLADSWNRELSLKLSSENINGGHSMIPLAAITGNPYFTFSNDGKKDENGMYNFFKDNTSNKVINFKKNEIKKISNIGNHLYSTHAYSVLEVYEDEDKNKIKMIKLRNPHNSDGIDLSEALLYNSNSKNIGFNSKKVFINEKNKTKIEKGTVTMRFDVFCKLLNEVEFG